MLQSITPDRLMNKGDPKQDVMHGISQKEEIEEISWVKLWCQSGSGQ